MSTIRHFLTGFVEGLLGIDLGPKNPTRDFGGSFRQQLIWDFRTKGLNGIQFGDPVEALRSFGKSDLFDEGLTDAYQLTYTRSGFFVGLDPEPNRKQPIIDYFGILTDHDPSSEIEVTTNSKTVTLALNELKIEPGGMILNSSTSRKTLAEIFKGSLFNIDSDDEEDIISYIFDGIEYEFEFHFGGDLKRINIYPET